MQKRENIVITGPMGVGKTTVARNISKILGLPFIDMDEEIEKQEGIRIEEIFEKKGEPYFRQKEKELVKKLAQKNGLIISTGGGTLIDKQNLELFYKNSQIFCLMAKERTLYQRLSTQPIRPLLKKYRLKDLLKKREETYLSLPHQIETDLLPPEEITKRIIVILKTKKDWLWIRKGHKTYPVMIKQGIIQDIKNWLDLFEVGNNLFMITDPRVLKLHGDKIIDRLRTKRRDISLHLVPEGRKGKNLTEVNKIYTELAQKRATRDSVIVSLGGGSVGDLAGFIAATYMRGIGLIHIPTTLLAQVDSSIGGKVGVDHPKAKNLIGSFYEPICVITDPQVLLTLDQREFSQGLTEVIKGAIIGSEKLFGFLEANVSRILKRDLEVLLYMIQVSSKIKAKIVEEDPEEKDKRRVLNLGHTIGHAIEILKEEISHGEAVSVGLMAACRLGVKMGILKEEVLERISSLLLRFHLPLKVLGIDPKKVLDVIELDKKIKRKKVFFIVPERIGKVRIVCEPSRELIFESVEETLA